MTARSGVIWYRVRTNGTQYRIPAVPIPPSDRGNPGLTVVPACPPSIQSRGVRSGRARSPIFAIWWGGGASPSPSTGHCPKHGRREGSGSAAVSSGTPLLTLWGQGGEEAEDGEKAPLFWGMDVQSQGPGREWIAGLALAESGGRVARSLSGGGTHVSGFAESVRYRLEPVALDTSLSAVYPYARASFGDLTLWGMAGSGRGTVDSLWIGDAAALHMDIPEPSVSLTQAERVDIPEGSIRLGDDLAFGMGLFGVERVLHEGDGLSLSVLGDAGWSRLSVESGAAAGISASVSRTRLGLRADYVSPDGWTGGLRVSGRVDGGDGETGSGVEFAGNARRGWGRWHAGLEGRWYTAESSAGTTGSGEALDAGTGLGSRSVSATLGLDHRGDGTGLAFGLTPGWGMSASGGEDTGQEGILEVPDDPYTWIGGWAAWGAMLPGQGIASGLLTPDAELRLERGGARHVRAGIDLRALNGLASFGLAVDHQET